MKNKKINVSDTEISITSINNKDSKCKEEKKLLVVLPKDSNHMV